jgi:hypothetical protein
MTLSSIEVKPYTALVGIPEEFERWGRAKKAL